ncbi:MAG TPA: hypothetical protein VNC23_01910, partial [Lapillicoccus sp.]|nr:hypothetical protein [Lapillicoccus sp.]
PVTLADAPKWVCVVRTTSARSLGGVAELTEPCPNCGAMMRWETSHERCPGCGWIRPCCEGAPGPVPSETDPQVASRH